MGAAASNINFGHEAMPRIGSPAEFAAARRVFEDNGYTYANLCARLGVKRLHEYRMPAAAEIFARPVEDGLAVLDRLFCQGLHLERSVVERYLTSVGRAALCDVGLLASDPSDPEFDSASAQVLPFFDGLFASDRFCTPSGAPLDPPPDAVYAALFENTCNFVARIPDTPCEALLDLGTGAGVAAICKSASARQVWATDITSRAVHFTEFNRRLNGSENVATLAGDLYEPVRGLTFDRIVCHPPYVAAESDTVIYRDGGKDGEQIFRRIVEGLPEFLRRGGTCYALLMATDREGEPFERRILKWLGKYADEFDILVACDVAQEPMEFLQTAQKITRVEREYRRILYRETLTTAVLYCSAAIRRRRKEGPGIVRRAFVGSSVRGEDLDFYLAWNAVAASPAGFEMLWNARPVLSAHCEFIVTHRVREGRLTPEQFELRTNGPFRSQGKAPGWVQAIFLNCDGKSTWGDCFEKCKSEGAISPAISQEEFARMLIVLVSTGALEVSKESFGFHRAEW